MSTQAWRLPEGGRIRRDRPLRFVFDGRQYTGFEGDTLASALLASGVHLLGRSFKYHRPRGVLAAGLEEPNALVQRLGPDEQPNVSATTCRLRAGLEARSLNAWPTRRFDLGAINDRLHRLFPAGFYYKTFIAPSGGWTLYSRLIRRMAGLGRAPATPPAAPRGEKRFHHCDVLIVGAGPAGLAAAVTAGSSGQRVLLVDSEAAPGGRAVALDIPGVAAWVDACTARLGSLPGVRYLPRATAVGYYDHNMVYVHELPSGHPDGGERLWRVRARQVILATGAHERPLVFADNDRPGILLAGAIAEYIRRYAVCPGRRAVFVTNNDAAYDAARIALQAGIAVVAIVDVRAQGAAAIERARQLCDVPVLSGYTIVAVHGRRAVRGISVQRPGEPASRMRLRCDVVGVSGGFNPCVQLHAQSGGRPRYAPGKVAFVPGDSVQPERSAGAATGAAGVLESVREGIAAAQAALRALSATAARTAHLPDCAPWAFEIEPAWILPQVRHLDRAFVDFGHDVTAADLRLALRENYASIELVKRYTTTGMAVDQGKTGNVNAIGLIAAFKEQPIEAIGTTTFRPMYRPVSFATLAGGERGELVLPVRRTPLTGCFESAGAHFDEAGGGYRRPFFIPRPGETPDAAVAREALAARNAAGLYDGSPLGKFELFGPDVSTFLDRVYTNSWTSLRIGMGRFGWMLREDGRLLDDGVSFRLGPQHYLMSTGSGAAEGVQAHLEKLLQCCWPQLRVYILPVTEQWANVCVCGPRAREVLRAAGTDLDLDPRAFPFMALRQGRVAGLEARIARVSYTGELSFEINVRSSEALALWSALLRAGEPFGITPLGSQTSLLLRLEKGFIAAWAEGDGYVDLIDVGNEWAIDWTKPDFIGRRALERNRRQSEPRRQVVGLLPEDPRFVPPDGAPLIALAAAPEPEAIGHVTAAAWSPNLGRSITLAQLEGGRERHGQHLIIATTAGNMRAQVTAPVFLDPRGERMRS